MPPQQDEPEIYERTYMNTNPFLKHKNQVLVVCILLALLAAGFVWYQLKFQTNTEVPTEPERKLVGGTIYYSADTIDDNGYVPLVYRHSFFEDKRSNVYFGLPAHAFAKGDGTLDAMIVHQQGTDDPDYYQPSWYNPATGKTGLLAHQNGYDETDLAVAPNHTSYAYSYQTTPDGDSLDHADWNVAVHIQGGAEASVIQNASEPEWIEGGGALIYMKKDGLYRYNVRTKEETLIFGELVNLSMREDFTVTPDGGTLVLTLPSMNSILVLQRQNNDTGKIEYTKTATYVTDAVRHRHPLISPTGDMFAVMAAFESDYDATTERYTRMPLEVRSLSDGTIIQSVTLPDFLPSSIRLEQWLTE